MSSNEISSEAESLFKENSKNKVISKKGTIMKSNYYAVKLGKNNKLYISLNSKKNEENEGETDNESAGTGTDTDSFGDEEESEDIGKDVDSQTADSDIVDLSRNDLESNDGVQNINYAGYGSNDHKFNNDIHGESTTQVDKNLTKSTKKRSKNEKNIERSISMKKRKIAHILDSAEESLSSTSSSPIVTGYSLEHMPPQSSYSSTPARRTSKRSTILDLVEVEETERKEELKKRYEASLKTGKSNFQNDPGNEFSTANNQSKNSDLRDGFSKSTLTGKKRNENFKYNKIKLKLTNINSDLLGLLDSSDKKPKAKKRGKPPKNPKKSSDISAAGSVEPVDHNEDFCSACGGIGNFLCCEGCPKSFHLECLNPPLEEDELPEGDWFCNHCIIRKLKEQHIKLPTVNGIFGKLIINMKKKNPRKFDLPSGIWQRFEGVSKGKYGEFSVENEYYKEIVGKKGLQQAQAVHIYDSQIDDENSENITTSTISTNVSSEHSNHKGSSETLKSESLPKPLFCYHCGKSGLHANKNLIKCEYCPLVWHLDCLNPPLSSIKILGKKWKCPNHIDDLINHNPRYISNIPEFSNGGLKVKDRTDLNVCVSRKFSNNGFNFEIISDIKKPSKLKSDDLSSKNQEEKTAILKQTNLFDNLLQLNHDFKSTNLSKRKLERIEKTFNTNDGVGAVIRTKYWKNYTLSPKYGDFGKGEKQIFEDDNNDSIVYRYPESSVILDFVDSVKVKRQKEIDNFNSRTICIFNQIVDSINKHEEDKTNKVLDLSQIETARNLLELQCGSKKINSSEAIPFNSMETHTEALEEQQIMSFIQHFGEEKILQLLQKK